MAKRHPMEWFVIGEAIVAALDEGRSQREVAHELGKVARWWLAQVGETRWWQKRTSDKRAVDS